MEHWDDLCAPPIFWARQVFPKDYEKHCKKFYSVLDNIFQLSLRKDRELMKKHFKKHILPHIPQVVRVEGSTYRLLKENRWDWWTPLSMIREDFRSGRQHSRSPFAAWLNHSKEWKNVGYITGNCEKKKIKDLVPAHHDPQAYQIFHAPDCNHPHPPHYGPCKFCPEENCLRKECERWGPGALRVFLERLCKERYMETYGSGLFYTDAHYKTPGVFINSYSWEVRTHSFDSANCLKTTYFVCPSTPTPTCTCMAGQYHRYHPWGKPCKHLRKVMDEFKLRRVCLAAGTGGGSLPILGSDIYKFITNKLKDGKVSIDSGLAPVQYCCNAICDGKGKRCTRSGIGATTSSWLCFQHVKSWNPITKQRKNN